MYISTLIFYTTFIFICTIAIGWSKWHNTKIGIYWAYAALALLSILRYDIGNDYDSYVSGINYLSRFTSINWPLFVTLRVEPFFLLLVHLFKNFAFSYLWIYGIYSILEVFILYKIFSFYNIHNYAFLIIFINGLLFFCWDGLRQGLAFVIFLYAIRYIKEHNFKKYLILIFLAATTHFSALILIPFYYFSQITPKRLVYIIVILGLAFFASGSLFQKIFNSILEYAPAWYATNAYSHAYVQITSEMYRLRIIFYSLFWCSIIYYLPDTEKIFINFIFFGAVIFIIASGALNLMRISYYFIFTTTISLPLVLKYLNINVSDLKSKIRQVVIKVVLVGVILFFIHDVITDSGTRGCVPYKSIFSIDFQMQKFDR